MLAAIARLIQSWVLLRHDEGHSLLKSQAGFRC